jgi:hypothetical protein
MIGTGAVLVLNTIGRIALVSEPDWLRAGAVPSFDVTRRSVCGTPGSVLIDGLAYRSSRMLNRPLSASPPWWSTGCTRPVFRFSAVSVAVMKLWPSAVSAAW